MLAVKSMDVRGHFKEWCDKVFSGETLIISRPKNENIVMISETEYNEMMRIKRNVEYLTRIDKSLEELNAGKTMSFSLEESDETRTHKIFNALEEICYEFDLSKPIWLDVTIAEFKKHAKARFYQDNFVDSIDFDYLEIQIIEE